MKVRSQIYFKVQIFKVKGQIICQRLNVSKRSNFDGQSSNFQGQS
jgi:hypothetical protein